MSRGDNIKGDDKAVFNQLADAIEARDRKIAALREAANRVIDDIHDYERTNNLAPNSGRKECWDSVAALVEALTGSPSLDPAEAMRAKCEDCPPVGYPDTARCLPCPRRAAPSASPAPDLALVNTEAQQFYGWAKDTIARHAPDPAEAMREKIEAWLREQADAHTAVYNRNPSSLNAPLLNFSADELDRCASWVAALKGNGEGL